MKLNKCAALPLMALVLAACNGSSSSSATTSSPQNSGLKIGIVFDSGGRGDKSFNDSAWAGVQRAENELHIPESDVKTVDSKSEKDYEGNITGMAEAGCNMIFAVGLAQGDALQTVAPKYPKVNFAIIDGQVDQPNVRSIQFSEEQGSYLAGYLAGLVTKTNKIGFVGGMKMAIIQKFQAGYEAGAKAANPNIQILPAKYTQSWDDTQLGKAAAETLYNDGADIVYHAAGRCGLGVIEAAKEQNKFAIGVDQDQDDQAPGNVLTSMVKHVDNAVYQTIKDAKDNKFTPGVKRYDLMDDGVGLTDFKFTKKIIGKKNIDKVLDQRDKIINGQIKVPTTL